LGFGGSDLNERQQGLITGKEMNPTTEGQKGTKIYGALPSVLKFQ
jgi:hypothetical protein